MPKNALALKCVEAPSKIDHIRVVRTKGEWNKPNSNTFGDMGMAPYRPQHDA